MNKNFEPIDKLTEEIASKVIEAAFQVHRELGPGLLEFVYEKCLCYELNEAGLKYESQKPISIKYKGIIFNEALRIDILVENKIVLEIKSVDEFNPLFEAQLLTYMKLTDCRLGFIINFNVSKLKDGIHRYVL